MHLTCTVILKSFQVLAPGYTSDNLNIETGLQVWPLRLMESYTTKILPQLITVTPGLLFTWQNDAFPDKNTGDFTADKILMMFVILHCLPWAPCRGDSLAWDSGPDSCTILVWKHSHAKFCLCLIGPVRRLYILWGNLEAAL